MPLVKTPWGYIQQPDDMALPDESQDPVAGARAPATASFDPLTSPLLKRQDKGSGAEASGSTKENTKTNVTENRAIWAPSDDMASISQGIEHIPAVQAQIEGQKALENLLSMQAQASQGKAQLDYSPLADLTNYVTEGRYKSTYKPPQTSDQLRDKLATYGNVVADNRRDIAKTILDGVSKFKAGTSSNQQMTDLINQLSLKFQDPDKDKSKGAANNNDKFLNQINKDKALQKGNDVNQLASEIRGMLTSDNPVAINNLPLAIVKLYNVGRPTNYELTQEKGARDVVSKFNQALESLSHGDLTPENKQMYIKYVDDILQSNKELIEYRRNRLRSLGKSAYGASDQVVNDALPPLYTNPHPTSPAKTGAAPKDRSKMTLQELEAEAKARGIQ